MVETGFIWHIFQKTWIETKDNDKDKDNKVLILVVEMQGTNICDVLRDLVLFGQFKKREKYPWGSATYTKVAD